ncbi:class F sortase [Kitasatospora sp. NPDC098652]|uniref:class F sortase n=1 Tax=Kitasatospora sp. NPDC098652 TaxID=3364095 RepID=UPI0038190FE0
MTSSHERGRPLSFQEGGRPRRAVRRGRGAALVAVSAGMALVGAGASALLGVGPSAPVTSARPAARADVGALPTSRPTDDPSPATPAAAAAPLRIRIPGIGLDSDLTDLQVQPDGHLAAPQDPGQIGWWKDGPRPGDAGAAVIVGHLDSQTGPAAFYGLSTLHPGDTIGIDRADHTHVDFTVQALRQYDKDAIPDNEVYATGGPPQLRLITCGGTYDRQQHEYRDNLVVYATLTPAPSAHPTATASPSTDRSGN